jgi:hypothetical protein
MTTVGDWGVTSGVLERCTMGDKGKVTKQCWTPDCLHVLSTCLACFNTK